MRAAGATRPERGGFRGGNHRAGDPERRDGPARVRSLRGALDEADGGTEPVEA